MALSHADRRKLCPGCENDFYNGPRGFNGYCWMLPRARLQVRYRIGTWTLPTEPGAFQRVKVFQCRTEKGQHFTEKLPDFVKLEEVIGSPAWKRKTANAEGRVRGRQKT